MEKKSDWKKKYFGFPGGVLIFLILYFMPAPSGLSLAGQGALAAFALAFVWWVTEPIPNHVTSIFLMVLLVFLGVRPEAEVLGALGLGVIWLNIAAFVLSSVLMKTRLAKRVSLMIVSRFGHSGQTILFAFLVLQFLLSPLIPSSAARTVMTLPIMVTIAAIYGSTADKPNRFGKNLFLSNLQAIDMSGSAFITGSAANVLAAAFIIGMASHRIYYTDWMLAGLPVALGTLLIAVYLGPRLIFRMKAEEMKPQTAGGLDALKAELQGLGAVSFDERKGAIIFSIVLVLWMTDRYHMEWFGFEISAVMAALIGAIIALTPKIGVLKWKEAEIPWHLLLFSAGAYAGGLALESTGAARWLVTLLMDAFGIKQGVNFWVVYIVIMAVSAYSHVFFTSKTMRTIILIPLIIALAQKLGFDPVALALPAAITMDWVISLPINAKPNLILYSAGHFSVSENFRSGMIVTTIGFILLIVAGFTIYRLFGIVPY